MQTLIYFSRNRKNPPFEVTIRLSGQTVYINCSCELGLEHKICRHVINAIRGDKDNCHTLTTDETIQRLRKEFGMHSSLRLHLEEKWRALREFASEFPDNKQAIAHKRKLLGEAFSSGFKNESLQPFHEPFDTDEWEEQRETISDNISIPASLTYASYGGEITKRDVIVKEIFSQGSALYLLAHCKLREQTRTFRVDRIHGIEFPQDTDIAGKSMLLDAIFRVAGEK